MKNVIALGLLLLVLASCNKKNRYTQDSPEIDIVKAVINNYDYQKWDSLTMNYADTAKVYYNTRNLFFTAKSLPEYHKKNDSSFLTRAFEENRREFEMVTDDNGKKWVNFWGIWEGNLLENNKKIEMPVHITYQFINKKIVLEYGYWDASQLVLELQRLEDMKKADTIFIN
ncbi:nuclear transport factor 2 family protein [Lacinutrix sp. C3R15]|uniref:nuclear transport factor 2 family protein n=1 Tax=Flavobacteriaceae TaxID=49546 RepID=UPI001C0A0CF8|nr:MULTISPECIES: nuclear transport factor 2 family protein [Flavobacteriaceae]MBU2940231.1 nuclear transport factor 2 family protein [Lacinutrix sp. C3R15]MDO6623549.1 nuclear transport factor 2 family protein [Oceanihabitans sp. 1_MG-2023]